MENVDWTFQGIVADNPDLETDEEGNEAVMLDRAEDVDDDNDDDDEDDVEDEERARAGHVHFHTAVSPTFADVSWADQAVVTAGLDSVHASAWNASIDDLRIGLWFKDKDDLQRAVKLYHIRNHQQYKIVDTNSIRWCIRCKKAVECNIK